MPGEPGRGPSPADSGETGVELERLVAALVSSVAAVAAESTRSPVALRSAKLHLAVAFHGAGHRLRVIVDSDRLARLPSHSVSMLEIELFASPDLPADPATKA